MEAVIDEHLEFLEQVFALQHFGDTFGRDMVDPKRAQHFWIKIMLRYDLRYACFRGIRGLRRTAHRSDSPACRPLAINASARCENGRQSIAGPASLGLEPHRSRLQSRRIRNIQFICCTSH
eukprot:06236_3